MNPVTYTELNVKDFKINTPEPLKKFLPGFMQRRHEDILNLRELIKNQSFSEISDIGHKLKGHGVSYGFEIISIIGQNLETCAKNENSPDIEVLIQKYETVIIEIEGSLNP